jgi:nucleoid DNA-binding protein
MADFSRQELVREVAAILDLSERKTKPIVKSVIQAITNVLQTGERLYIQGFGVFSHKKRAGRYVGMNIPGMFQGKSWIPPHSAVVFTPEASLNYDLNKDLYADTPGN